jgi:hypothetical protein
VLALFATTLGCSFERVSRPPTPAEIARIDASASGRKVNVRYVEPLVGAPSARRLPVNFTRVVSADASTLTLEGPNGAPTAVPLSEVRAVSVNVRRGRAAAIGAGIVGGAVVGVATVVLAVQAASIIRASDGGDYCSVTSCAPAVLVLGLGGAAVGVLLGAAIGSNEIFSFNAP